MGCQALISAVNIFARNVCGSQGCVAVQQSNNRIFWGQATVRKQVGAVFKQNDMHKYNQQSILYCTLYTGRTVSINTMILPSHFSSHPPAALLQYPTTRRRPDDNGAASRPFWLNTPNHSCILYCVQKKCDSLAVRCVKPLTN